MDLQTKVHSIAIRDFRLILYLQIYLFIAIFKKNLNKGRCLHFAYMTKCSLTASERTEFDHMALQSIDVINTGPRANKNVV